MKAATRKYDHATSIEAAEAITPKLNAIQQAVLGAFRRHGPMTDEQLEQLARFSRYAPSTIRKRRSELFQWGILIKVGEKLNSRNRKMDVWNIKETPKQQTTFF